MNEQIQLVHVDSQEDKNMAFEQYKMIFNSINQLSRDRETSNQFWIIVNTAAFAGISYLKQLEHLESGQRIFFLAILLLLGCVIAGCWLQYLMSVKENIERRFEMLKELEAYFPVKTFIKLSAYSAEDCQ